MQESAYSKNAILIMITSFFYMAGPMIVMPLMAGFIESLGTGGAMMGFATSLTSLAALVCRPLAGNIADRMRKSRLALFGVCCLIVGSLGYALVHSPWLVLLFRVITGIGFAFTSASITTWLTMLLPPDKIGSGMGLFGAVNALSLAIFPAIGIAIYQAVGYRLAFVVSMVCTAVCALLISLVSDKGDPVNVVDKGEKPKFQLYEPAVVPIAAIVMLFAMPYCANQSFLVRYTEMQGLELAVSLYFPVYSLVLVSLRLALRDLFDRLPFGVFFVSSSVCTLAALLCLTCMTNNVWLIVGAVFMAGGYGIMFSVCQATTMLIAAPEKRGVAGSTYYIGLDIGMALGPIIGGFIYGHLPLDVFYPIFMLSMPLALVAFLMHHRQHKTEKS